MAIAAAVCAHAVYTALCVNDHSGFVGIAVNLSWQLDSMHHPGINAAGLRCADENHTATCSDIPVTTVVIDNRPEKPQW